MKNKYCDDFRTKVSPLHHVMARGSTDMVTSLLQNGLHNLNSRDSAGQTPLYYAIFRGYRYGVKLLLEQGASINVKDDDENTPLHFAVKKGNIKIVSDLLMKGADLEQSNKYGQTVLQYAIAWNYSVTFEPIVELLLSKGASVNSRDKDKDTPLHSATARKDSKLVCLLLLERGANIDARDKNGNSPLHIASMKQCKEAIVTLIDKGADINGINGNGDTPLHIAVKSKVPESLALLLELKADINATNLKGKTALHVATKLGYDVVMKELMDHGASLEVRDYKGNTALHCASKSYYGHRTADILLEGGANINMLNNFCETPLQSSLNLDSRCNPQCNKKMLDWAISVNSKNYFTFPDTLRSDQFDTFMEHFIKLKCAQIHFDCDYEYELPFFDFIDKIHSTYREVDKMKANRFGRHTLYDIFSSYSDPRYFSNNDLKEAISSPKVESCYPTYGYLLKITYKKAKKRLELLNKAQTSLKIPLPNEIQRKILAYLDDFYLEILVTAFQSS